MNEIILAGKEWETLQLPASNYVALIRLARIQRKATYMIELNIRGVLFVPNDSQTCFFKRLICMNTVGVWNPQLWYVLRLKGLDR